jgi:hypothetical protein
MYPAMTTQQQIAKLNELWTSNISDPGPEEKQWHRWLGSFNYEIVTFAVNATINRYRREPSTIDFIGCMKFTSATARRKAEETAGADKYGVPQSWLQTT